MVSLLLFFLLLVLRCGPVPERQNVVPDTTNTAWGTTVSYQCAPGYNWADSTLVSQAFFRCSVTHSANAWNCAYFTSAE